MKIVIATQNQGKLKEFREILRSLDCEIVSMAELGINIDVIEDADTFEGNAVKKATEIMKVCGEITIADDSGLSVDVLGGEPGVYSARYSGVNPTDFKNNKKLLAAMEGQQNRAARFICCIAAAFPDGRIETAFGEMEGLIDTEMKGEGGFGYDVLFYLPQFGMTSAEIPASLKNSISHRYKALSKMAELLEREVKSNA